MRNRSRFQKQGVQLIMCEKCKSKKPTLFDFLSQYMINQWTFNNTYKCKKCNMLYTIKKGVVYFGFFVIVFPLGFYICVCILKNNIINSKIFELLLDIFLIVALSLVMDLIIGSLTWLFSIFHRSNNKGEQGQ